MVVITLLGKANLLSGQAPPTLFSANCIRAPLSPHKDVSRATKPLPPRPVEWTWFRRVRGNGPYSGSKRSNQNHLAAMKKVLRIRKDVKAKRLRHGSLSRPSTQKQKKRGRSPSFSCYTRNPLRRVGKVHLAVGKDDCVVVLCRSVQGRRVYLDITGAQGHTAVDKGDV